MKFRVLADELRRGIAEIRWPEGRLPTEQQLAAEQQVSLNTVRRAVDLLVSEGLVYRRQGSGTYVAPGKEQGLVIGVAVPSMTYYYPRIIAGIESELAAHGAQMLLRSTAYDLGQEKQAVEGLIAAGAQGLLLVPELTQGTDLAAYVVGLARPAVLVERRQSSGTDLHEFVCSNHAAGGYLAARHLLSLGHSRVACLARGNPHAGHVRRGLLGALADADLEPALDLQLDRWNTTDAEDVLDQLLATGATAAVCFADREGALLMSAARRRGLRIPRDLALIGYDDEVADLAEVPLTAVSPAKHAVGRLAVRTLMRRLAEPDAPLQQHLVVPKLVVRESTDIHSFKKD